MENDNKNNDDNFELGLIIFFMVAIMSFIIASGQWFCI